MAAIMSGMMIVLTLLVMVSVPGLSENSAVNPVSADISAACQASQFAEACKSSLMNTSLGSKRAGAEEIVKTAIGLSLDGVKESYRLSESLLASATDSHNFNSTVAAHYCLEAMGAAIRTFSRSGAASLGKRAEVKDGRAWMSAALTYEYDFYSAFNRLNRSDLTATIQQMNSTMTITSTALSMVAAIETYGRDMKLWRPPRTERSANSSTSETSSGYDDSIFDVHNNGVELLPNVTVSLDNTSEYSSVQAAVDGAPDFSVKVFVIHVKAGVYREIVRVPPSKTNLMLVGDGMDRTVITGSMNALQPGVGTPGSATVGVNADGFVARDIMFENSAGPEMSQAVALRVDSDLSAFHRCAIVGHQDTLYAHTLRQFYSNCRIEGTVDFIFGNAAAIFRNSTILIRPRILPSKNGETSPIAAHGRLDPGQSTGFVFDKCIINGTEQYLIDFHANPQIHKAYLGRPWKLFSRTIIMRSYIGDLIRPEGWQPWDGTFALDTLFYGESDNYGPGANVSARVAWSAQISPLAVGIYSPQTFIQADRWLPFLLSNYLN
uniref:Pectinesterase n=1 Tax=Cunninghamia lanceolata TaxID=28977 RepID=A0A6G9W1U8_CUNLA|nr:pectin methylesterase 2 [Cunninghamia lanceolata]